MIKEANKQKIIRDLKNNPDLFSVREEKILTIRYGLNIYGSNLEKKPHTLQEVGDIFGLTRERVRQIEVNCLKRVQ